MLWKSLPPVFAGILPAVLLPSGCREDRPASDPPSRASISVAASLTGVTAERSGDSLHLTVSLQVRNASGTPLRTGPPAIRLLRGDGQPVPPFIAPGLEPAVIPPGTAAAVETHWWLAPGEADGGLTMESGGMPLTVKDPAPFEAASLPENQPAALDFPRWKPAAN